MLSQMVLPEMIEQRSGGFAVWQTTLKKRMAAFDMPYSGEYGFVEPSAHDGSGSVCCARTQ